MSSDNNNEKTNLKTLIEQARKKGNRIEINPENGKVYEIERRLIGKINI